MFRVSGWSVSRVRLLADEFASHDKTLRDEFDTDLDITRRVMRQLGEQVAIDSDRLAVSMIGAGLLPSQGYSLGHSSEQRGGLLIYMVFPVDSAGRQVSLSGGGFENRTT